MPIPSGATTWQSDPNWSPTSPTRSKITPAKVTPSQSGHHREAHPSTALIGEIAVWRAANGINPQDPRPTGGGQLETAPALWKQRLDRHIAHSTDSSGNAGLTNDRQHTPHLDARTTTASARTKHPVNVRTGQPHPAANHRRGGGRGTCQAATSVRPAGPVCPPRLERRREANGAGILSWGNGYQGL